MLEKQLFEWQDSAYKAFQCRLIPTVNPDTVIGVRTPQLRRLAREIAGTPQAAEFMLQLPHRYYEENSLHGFLIEQIRDFDQCIAALETFLPYVNNWATCDTMSPKALIRQPDRLLVQIGRWLRSDQTYTVRFGIGQLMSHYLDARFCPEYPQAVAAVCSQEYYINMMRAWYFATALAKQYAAVLPFLAEHRLDAWTHNKAIQKACESRRLTQEQKDELRRLKRL